MHIAGLIRAVLLSQKTRGFVGDLYILLFQKQKWKSHGLLAQMARNNRTEILCVWLALEAIFT